MTHITEDINTSTDVSAEDSKEDGHDNFFIMVEPEIIQPAGSKLKLTWKETKLLISLRMAAGPFGDDQNVAMRSDERLMQESGFKTAKGLNKAIEKLKNWPSRRKSVIQSVKGSNIYMRPLNTNDKKRKGVKFIKIYRWLWEAKHVPDSLKSIIWFARTKFERKTKDGTEVFSLPIRSTDQTSIIKCCHLTGTHMQGRLRTVSEMVSLGIRTGLLTVESGSTSNRAMQVSLNDSTRTRTISEAFANTSGYQQNISPGTSETSSGYEQDTSQGTTLQTPLLNPSLEPSLRTRAGRGSPSPYTGIEQIQSNGRIDPNLRILLMVDQEMKKLETVWNKSRCSSDKILNVISTLIIPTFLEIMKEAGIPEDRYPAITEILVKTITATQFGYLRNKSWGLLLSEQFQSRFIQEFTDQTLETIQSFLVEKQREAEKDERIRQIRESDNPDFRLQQFQHLIKCERKDVLEGIALQEPDTATALQMAKLLALQADEISPGLAKVIRKIISLPDRKKDAFEWRLFCSAIKSI